MKRLIFMIAAILAAISLLAVPGCGRNQAAGVRTADTPADGVYQIAVTLTGGTGRASVASPAVLTVQDGKLTAAIVWSSPNYDYMLVDETRCEAEIIDGHSVFEIPVAALDTELPVIADTVAMSTPHEIAYTLFFDSSTLTAGIEAAS